MRRFVALATAIPVASAAIAVLAMTTVAGAGPSALTETFRFVERDTTSAVTDTGAKGDSAGDILTWANVLYSASNTKSVGSDKGYCVRTVVRKAWECSWTAFLPGGQITVQGPFLDAGPNKVAVTGGTGRFSGVAGWMEFRARNDKEWDYTYHVQR